MASSIHPRESYNVGIICALDVEKAAVEATLDEEHESLSKVTGDDNDYTFGKIGKHNVVVACLPAGIMGTAPASAAAKDMMRSFPVKAGFMVGISGGVWSEKTDVRLGDVVVSQPHGMHGGVVQWDFGKMEKEGVFRRTGTLNKPPRPLLNAVQSLKSKHRLRGSDIARHLQDAFTKYPLIQHEYGHQGRDNDKLFEASYSHLVDDNGCDLCDPSKVVERFPERQDNKPKVHYGNIASGNEVVKDGPTRDRIAKEEGILCFEMEAAGLMDTFPCVVIRGVCDYADSHKNKRWQPYAAMTAACYAKELLSVLDRQGVDELPVANNYMLPPLIVRPTNHEDLLAAVKDAKQKKIAVAIKSGSHQYSRASYTSGANILIDMKRTYWNLQHDIKVLDETPDKLFVYCSASFSLGEFNGFLKRNSLFIPHGHYADVYIGEHAQTGGYGQLCRSFGLLGDHVRKIRLVDHNAELKIIDTSSDPDLFNAILGGGPGNFGVVTHYTFEVYRDSDYHFKSVGGQGPHGLRVVWWYSKATLKTLLAKVAEMADDPNFPRNYDLCVSVFSPDFPVQHVIPEMDGVMKRDHPEIYGLDGQAFWPATIVLYAQWVPFTKYDRYDRTWFESLDKCSSRRILSQTFDEPMSRMTGEWIFKQPREFDHPCEKHVYMTSAMNLSTSGWVNTVSSQIDKGMVRDVTSDLWLKCWVSAQIQCFGGDHSKFRTNASNGTSYSWRDSTVCQVLNCFYESSSKPAADAWQAENDKLFVGPDSCFSKQDKRVLWGSYGDWDLHRVRSTYYENEGKYQHLQQVRAKADPDGTFTPNAFAVRRV